MLCDKGCRLHKPVAFNLVAGFRCLGLLQLQRSSISGKVGVPDIKNYQVDFLRDFLEIFWGGGCGFCGDLGWLELELSGDFPYLCGKLQRLI